MPNKYAEIIECDDYELMAHGLPGRVLPNDGEWYPIGWGYRDIVTGDVFTGRDDGAQWDESTAEQCAALDGYTIIQQTPIAMDAE